MNDYHGKKTTTFYAGWSAVFGLGLVAAILLHFKGVSLDVYSFALGVATVLFVQNVLLWLRTQKEDPKG